MKEHNVWSTDKHVHASLLSLWRGHDVGGETASNRESPEEQSMIAILCAIAVSARKQVVRKERFAHVGESLPSHILVFLASKDLTANEDLFQVGGWSLLGRCSGRELVTGERDDPPGTNHYFSVSRVPGGDVFFLLSYELSRPGSTVNRQ